MQPEPTGSSAEAGVEVRFLLGPAGSGKTHRCVAEIRAALRASAAGPSLILVAPKQATFQLERQLLAAPDLPGYTRLRILSFERLAHSLLEALAAPPDLLDDEGRVMVLRAILAERQPALRVFRATARLPGFAQQFSLLLRELQQHQLSANRLAEVARRFPTNPTLADKLQDFALLLRAYLDWLKAHALQDAHCLLDLATATARDAAGIKAGSDRGPRATDHGVPMADGQSSMTNGQSRISDRGAPDVENRTSNIEHRTSNVEHSPGGFGEPRR